MNDLPTNRFKAGLASERTQIGMWSSLRSIIVADVLSGSGFDWIIIDMEHAPNDVGDVLAQLIALRGGTATGIVRPPWNDPVTIKRILDAGAQGVLVPLVDSAADALSAVKAVRYPSEGIRGVAAATAASRYGRVKDYHSRAAAEICLLVQVETRAGLDALDEIAQVDGIDGIFIGPADLAAALGHLGNPAHPEVQEAIFHALDRCKAAGKPAGILSGVKEESERYIEKGFSFVAVGTDAGLLARQSEALAQHFTDITTRAHAKALTS